MIALGKWIVWGGMPKHFSKLQRRDYLTWSVMVGLCQSLILLMYTIDNAPIDLEGEWVIVCLFFVFCGVGTFVVAVVNRLITSVLFVILSRAKTIIERKDNPRSYRFVWLLLVMAVVSLYGEIFWNINGIIGLKNALNRGMQFLAFNYVGTCFIIGSAAIATLIVISDGICRVAATEKELIRNRSRGHYYTAPAVVVNVSVPVQRIRYTVKSVVLAALMAFAVLTIQLVRYIV